LACAAADCFSKSKAGASAKSGSPQRFTTDC
jgi:hypothetical protein